MRKVFLILIFFVSASVFATEPATSKKVKPALAPAAPTVEELQQRVELLEERLQEWYERDRSGEGRIRPFLEEKINFGGYFEAAGANLSGPDTLTQTSAGAFALGINIAAEFTDNIRLVTQTLTGLSYITQNVNNNPLLTPSKREISGLSTQVILAQGYVEFNNNEQFKVQTGIGYVPYGIAFQQREAVLFHRRGGPQILAGGDANTVGIAMPLWMGVHILGAFPTESGRWGYNLYTISPNINPKTVGAGTRLWRELSEHLTAGVSFQYGQERSALYYSYGADLDLKYEGGGVLFEYGRNETTARDSSPMSAYLEPYWILDDGRWVVFGAVDYLEVPNRMVGTVPDPIKRLQSGGGINWLPIPNTRFRLVYQKYSYMWDTAFINGQKRELDVIDFSAGIAF